MNSPKVLFEDSDVVVVDKPAGVIVNRADTTHDMQTLQDWVELTIQLEKADSESDFIKRSGIVHRLDKETSGIILVAKKMDNFKKLQSQFKEGVVSKTYIALVHGSVLPTEGEIKVPIGRLPWNRTRFGVFPQGRESRTLYKVKEVKKWIHEKKEELLSLVEVYPKTGRTHQIRVHFQYLHHPLFSDELYAGRKTMREDRKVLPRHFLHATRISFYHPSRGERVEYESPLPEDLTTFLNALSSSY